MNRGNYLKIRSILLELDTEKEAEQTTIAYIQNLLHPYTEALKQAPTIDAIRDWISRVFPGELAKGANVELAQAYHDNNVKIGRHAVIKYLVTKIILLTINVTKDINDVTILPWDVQKTIASDFELSALTGIRNDPQTLQNGEPHLLPIVVNGYTHYVSQDFAAGLLSSSLKIKHNFGAKMFGVRLDPYFIHEFSRYRYDHPTKYTLETEGVTFRFNSPDFMQGFATGAEWAGDDHRDYWYEIKQTTETGETIKITF